MITPQKRSSSLFRRRREEKNLLHDDELNKDLNIFSIKLIKIVGAVAAAIGLLIVIAFWYWVIKMLYKVG